MWGNPTQFQQGKSIEKGIEKRWTLAQSIGKIFLIDPLNLNNVI